MFQDVSGSAVDGHGCLSRAASIEGQRSCAARVCASVRGAREWERRARHALREQQAVGRLQLQPVDRHLG